MDDEFEIVRPKTPLTDLIRCLEGREDDFLLVTNEENKLIGVITESDLMKTLKPPDRPTIGIGRFEEKLQKHFPDAAEELMTRDPVTVSKDTSIKEAIDAASSGDTVFV